MSAVDVVTSAVASVSASFVIWQDLDPRLVIFFVIGLISAEVFVTVRRRFSVACPKCGFDPILYKKNPELAALRVKAHYSERMEDPMSLFAPPPRLPSIVRKKA